MHWLHAQMALLDAARAVVSFAANWLLQSTLLIAAGLAVAWFLGRRGSALQSAMYRTTLAAVIVCPLVTSLLARGGVSGWSVELSVAWGYEELKSFPPESAEEATVVANSAAQGGPLPGDFGIVTGVGWDKRVERAPAHHAARPSRWAGARKLAFSTLQPAAEPPVSPNAPVRQSAAEARQPSAFHVRAFGYAAIGIALIWLAVSAWLLARLGLAWRRLGRLRRAAAVAEPTAQQACRELSALLAVAAPEVRRSPYLASPCLAGLRRPVVLLPEAEASLPLRDVLVHELAHLRRRDGWWNLLMRLTEALFFYQPLVWLLARRLESAAEEVCDDYVVQLGGDREGYARGLLEIAELSSPPVGAAGVAMVSLRSILARRVTRIVDSSRSLSTRTGNLLVVLIIAGGLIGATAVGFVGLGQRPSLADPPAASDAVDKKANAEAGKADDTESKRKAAEERGKPREQTDKPERAPDNQLHGIVVGADGKPVAGARLYWIRARVHDLQPEPPRLLATTGDDGKYHFAEPPPVEPTMPASWSYTDRIAVTAPGHGFAFTSPDEIRRATSPPAGFLEALARAVTGAQQERTRLPEAGEPVRGRLIDIDGQPVAGAKVRIRWFNGERDIGGYGDAEARGVENAVWRQRVANLMNVIEPVQLRDVLPSAVTDATGRFELRDIGAKRFVQLLVRGDGIEATEIVARNEPGEKIVLDRFEGGGTLAVYSNEFDFVVGPSKPVEGRVLDLDTGEPIADAVVRAFQVQGQLVTTSREREHLAATTDAAGRYRITGLPVGSGNSLVAFATGNAAYIPVGHATDTSAQGAVIERDFRLKRGVWAEGRVFDAETRKPFTGEISYHFFQNRELEEAIPGLTEAFLDGRYWTNANGEFRVPVLPSRGILAFRYDGFDKHHDIDRYPRGFGANEIAGGKDLGGGKVFPTLQQQLISTNYERVAEVSTTAGQESVRVDMPLFVSRPVAVRVVDPKGNPVVGFLAHGANERWGWQNQEGPQFEIQDLLPGERRKVFVFHRWRNLAGGGFVQYGGKETVEIKLVSGGSVQGRLVDADGEPIDDATISAAFAHDNSAVWAPHPSLARSPTGIPVDKQGRFRLDGLIPGWTYYSNASAPRPYQGQTIDMFIGIPFKDVQVNAGEVKDLGDLVVGDDSVSDNQEKGASSTQPVKESIVSGRVRDGDGRPVAGAAVDVRLAVFDADDPPLASTATDDAGRFEFSLRWPQFDERIGAKPDLLVVATADGLAPDWKYLRKDQPPGDIVLNLPEEKTITGRIVNAEGRPLAGVELRVETILRYDGDMMKMVLDDVAQGRTLLRMGKDWQYGALPKQPARVTTAADGRFRIAGLSANTVVKLHVRGAGIRHTTFEATTAVRETIRGPAPPVEPTSAPRAGRVLYGAVSDYVAEPARSIEGVVRDRATRRPVRGVKVRCWNTTTAVAETDEAGRYVLEGCGKEPNYTLSVEPRADGPAYFRASPTVADATGLAPLVQDVELVQGIELRGTIVDSETGRPLVAGIHYQPLYLNKHVASLAEQGVDLHSHSRSGPDGSFRIVVAPGPGALAVDRPDGVPNGYATIRVGYDDVVKLFERSPEHRALAHLPELKRGLPDSLPTARAGLAFGFMSQVGHARTVLISPDARTPPEPLDVRLVRGRTLSGQVLDASGQPLAGARAFLDNPGIAWQLLSSADFTVTALGPDEKRDIAFHHERDKLGAFRTITADEAAPLTVRLEPCGSAVGRVLDADGAPIEGMHVWFQRDGNSSASELFSITDANGRFRTDDLIPGQPYVLIRSMPGSMSILQFSRDKRDFSVGSGKTHDLGDLVVKGPVQTVSRKERKEGHELRGAAISVDASHGARATLSAKAKTVRGHVTRHGRAASGAHVAVIARRTSVQRGGDFGWTGEVLAEATTNENGEYRLNLADVSQKTHSYANVIARQDGSAIAWRQLNLDAAESEAALELPDHEAVRGKVIDVEGRPAPGVRISVVAVVVRTENIHEAQGVGYHGGDKAPAAWLAAVTSDAQGRFVLQGLAANHGVTLEVAGDDRFAEQDIALNTGAQEQRGTRDKTYRPLIKNVKPGEEAALVLAPAQPFEGTVRYADTGQCVPHARITIWASQEQFGSMVSVAGRADERGHYRISPRAGIRFGVTAYPPDGSAYLARETPLDKAIEWKAIERSKQVDMTLPRGVLVRGRVVEAGSETPVVGAAVQYLPETSNNRNASDDILTGWQAIQPSGQDGLFSIAVLPGPGRLLVNSPQGNYVLQGIGDRELSQGQPGGQRSYTHAIAKLDPQAGQDAIEVKVELEPGATVTGRIVDELGNPVDEALVVSRLNISPHSLTWRGHTTPTLGGRFELAGLAKDVEYPVCFLDAKRRLGAAEVIKAGDGERTVVLKPCGKATLRLTGGKGGPVSSNYANVEMVVTPGVYRYDGEAAQRGEFMADSDFISNIDRTNNPFPSEGDEESKLTLPALIPGASYRVSAKRAGKLQIVKEFQVKPNQTLDLGEIVVERE